MCNTLLIHQIISVGLCTVAKHSNLISIQLLKDSIMWDWDVQAAWNPTLDFASVEMFIVNDI